MGGDYGDAGLPGWLAGVPRDIAEQDYGHDLPSFFCGSSDNVAFYYCCGPKLFFDWDDSNGNWHGETVDNNVS